MIQGGGSVTTISNPQSQVRKGGQISVEYVWGSGRWRKTDVYQEAGAVYNKDVADWVRAVMSMYM